MTLAAEVIALLTQLLPEIAKEAPEVIASFETILNGASLPTFDAVAASARIAAAAAAVKNIEAVDDAALAAKFATP